ncbi:MAG TPA: Uma2 family endonuclease [Urbifossiella sp.]|jgi:Uma2 family endonuclease|nr:Uma2 family endonuclease [Urbifossiella sp.]
MTTASTVTPPPAPVRAGSLPAQGPAPKVWTVAQFHFLGDLGMFEGRGAKLMDGVIVEEGPINPPHAIAATKTEDLIREAFGKGWHVRVAKPLVLGQTTDPEPDVAVVPGRPGDHTTHPTTATLVVEVSDTSFRYDTTVKLAAYAAGQITDYWVVDVNARQVHVFRDPGLMPDGPGYATHLILGPLDSVAPLAVPAAAVRVAELLP